MSRKSKRCKEIEKFFEKDKLFSIKDAIEILKKCPKVKFDETVDVSVKLGIDPKKPEQQVRANVVLPKGTGKKVRILVFAKGDKAKEAKEAKADFVGHKELMEKIKGGWFDFDVIIATSDVMIDVAKLGKILGPRGLMPSPKSGNVTNEIKKAIEEIRKGKIDFKVDKSSVINTILGKLSFKTEDLEENAKIFIEALEKAKPSTQKGIYIKSFYISSTMGPGIKIKI